MRTLLSDNLDFGRRLKCLDMHRHYRAAMHKNDSRQAVVAGVAELEAEAPRQRQTRLVSNRPDRYRNDRSVEKLKVFLRAEFARRGDSDFAGAQAVDYEPADCRKKREKYQRTAHAEVLSGAVSVSS